LCGNSAVLLGLIAGAAHNLSLALTAEAEAKAGSLCGVTVVWLSNSRVEIEVNLAQVRTSDDTVGLAVKRVTESDRLVDNLLKLARRRIIIESLLNDIGEQMVGLLLTVADGRCSNNGTIESVAEALDLTPTITTALGATLIVGVDLVLGVEEVCGELATDDSQLSYTLVSEHVESVVVKSAVCVERDSVVVGGEISKASIGDTCCCTVDDATRE